MNGVDRVRAVADRLLVLLEEESAFLAGTFDAEAHAELTAEKCTLAETLGEALEEVKRSGRETLSKVDPQARASLAETLDTLRIGMTANETALKRQADLSRGILDAVAAAAEAHGGERLTTYGQRAPARPHMASIAVSSLA